MSASGLRPVTIHDAKTRFSELVKRVEAGEEIVIARGRTAVARLVPLASKAPRGRRFGTLRGRVKVDAAFFEPLPESELRRWGV